MSISEQEHQRRESLKDIIQLGLNPYPSEIFVINSSSDEIKNNFDEKTALLLLSFLIGSLILSCLGSISSSMNLLNKRNFSLGSIIVMIFSIPVIIFSVGIVNSNDNFTTLLNILLGILLIFIAISPWISGLCIRLALENK